MRTSTSPVASTVAERSSPVSDDISPKALPGPNLPRVSRSPRAVSSEASASPLSTTNTSAPGSSSLTMRSFLRYRARRPRVASSASVSSSTDARKATRRRSVSSSLVSAFIVPPAG